jgi:hypothetical protein
MLQVITISSPELQDIISQAYKEGYLKAQQEYKDKAAKENEPKFGEIIRGVKELCRYLYYKDYWKGTVSTLSKVAPQLLEEGEKQGHGLVFRRTCIDHAFERGFRFQPCNKKDKMRKMSA